MIFLWVPETKQRTLEELDYIFAVPTRTHMRYQFEKALPYFINHWILRRKDAVLEPLYQFDSAEDNDEARIAQLYENDRRRAELRKENSGSEENVEKVENGEGIEPANEVVEEAAITEKQPE
jgi:hypothetical protein